MKDDAGGPTEREIEEALKCVEKGQCSQFYLRDCGHDQVVAAAYRHERAAREAAENIVELAREAMWELARIHRLGDFDEQTIVAAMKAALKSFDAIRAGGSNG